MAALAKAPTLTLHSAEETTSWAKAGVERRRDATIAAEVKNFIG